MEKELQSIKTVESFSSSESSYSSDSENSPKTKKAEIYKKRRIIGTILPALLIHVCWWSYMGATNSFYLFEDNYFMTITMIFGSLVAGATSEGGGSIAFPIMTLAFKIAPPVARDFSFMIQSVGMTAAMFAILISRIPIEFNAFKCSSIGGGVGIIFGLQFVAPYLPAPVSKILFVSIWASFAFALYMLNRIHGRPVHLSIYKVDWKKKLWLYGFGFLGGIFSSISGSGIDICVFSCLTLRFRISEKIATPTSVCLMAINTMIGFFWRGVQHAAFDMPIDSDSFDYWLVSIPVVVFGAPLGSQIASFISRIWLARCVYFTDGVQFIAGLVIVLSAVPYAAILGASAGAIFLFGGLVFFGLTKLGEREIAHCKDKNNGDAGKSVEMDSMDGNKANDVTPDEIEAQVGIHEDEGEI